MLGVDWARLEGIEVGKVVRSGQWAAYSKYHGAAYGGN